MPVYLSHDSLRCWTDSETWQEGSRIYNRAGVRELILADPVQAVVYTGGQAVHTRFRILPDGTVESHCPCRRNHEFGLVCEHVVATGFAVACLTEDPRRERQRRITARMANENAPPTPTGDRQDRLRLRLPADWLSRIREGTVSLDCQIESDGVRRRLDAFRKAGRTLQLSAPENYLLYVLADLAGTDDCPGALALNTDLFLELLDERAPGDLWVMGEADPLHVERTPALSCLHVGLEPDGRLRIAHATEPEGVIVASGRKAAWMISGRALYPLSALLPPVLRDAYKGTVYISRSRVFDILDRELPALEDQVLIECAVDRAAFSVVTGLPAFAVDISGSAARLEIHLIACYGKARLSAGSPPNDTLRIPLDGKPRHYLQRDSVAEEQAIGRFRRDLGDGASGDGAQAVIEGTSLTLHTLAKTVPAWRKRQWDVRFKDGAAMIHEQAEWIYPELTARATERPGQFRVSIGFIDRMGKPIDPVAVDAALRNGQSFFAYDGRLLLIEGTAVNTVLTAFAECSVTDDDGALVDRIHAGFLTGLIESIDGARLDVDAGWRDHAERQQRRVLDEQVVIDEPLNQMLRPYQKEGVRWLRFCERCGYSGILADEMGLGKTVQALAWIRLARLDPAVRGRPSLVVCPTSLVRNWERESQRFVPELTRHVVSGPARHHEWENIKRSDLVFTSYALLRRDIELYGNLPFAVTVLDEAQHIKNRSTQNAKAAKRIKARHRLVLTGTPVENSVSDLWSIMDFLQPGYLGSHGRFTIRFERPINNGGAASELALDVLHRKMEPFILRRLKQAVAADLPPKVCRIVTCSMPNRQRRQYARMLSRYHDALAELVDKQGFEQSRFSILTALLRLRQICCHPALVRDPAIDPETPSGKVDLFFELLDEALDGGHRVLVFSQFVRMLHILRSELERRGIAYAYLDGGTKDRIERVEAFNRSADIPVFLVSLKAGGSGLNLTGADIVIHFDPWWNPAVEDQATDRAHRIGQTRTVYSIKLITEATIEEKVLALQARKRDIIDAAIGAVGRFESGLTWDDVREMLDMDSNSIAHGVSSR